MATSGYKFTRMKYQVLSYEHSRLIQNALFKRGIYWDEASAMGDIKTVQNQTSPFLYVDEDRKIRHGHSRDVFDEDMATEYVYRLGLVQIREANDPIMLEPLPQPIPTFHEAAKRLVGGGDLSDVDRVDAGTLFIQADDIVMTDVATSANAKLEQQYTDLLNKIRVEPPIGLRPRKIAERTYALSRVAEIGEAITRYTEEHKVIPMEWVNEYNEKILELEKNA